MSFNHKPNRPDSADTAKLRKEYEDKARQLRESSDPASRAKLRDDKQKAFNKVVERMSHERKANLSDVHKGLIALGKMKSPAQIAAETKAAEDARTLARAQR
jgi:hypothetical protein